MFLCLYTVSCLYFVSLIEIERSWVLTRDGSRKSWLTLKPSLKWFTLTIVSFYCFCSLFSRPPHFCLPRSRLQGHMNFVDKFIHKNWYKTTEQRKQKYDFMWNFWSTCWKNWTKLLCASHRISCHTLPYLQTH